MAHQNITLSYADQASSYQYKYNLTKEDGTLVNATVCYIGTASPEEIESAYDNLQQLFENGSEGKRTIVVFYKKGNQIDSMSDESAGSITDVASDNSTII